VIAAPSSSCVGSTTCLPIVYRFYRPTESAPPIQSQTNPRVLTSSVDGRAFVPPNVTHGCSCHKRLAHSLATVIRPAPRQGEKHQQPTRNAAISIRLPGSLSNIRPNRSLTSPLHSSGTGTLHPAVPRISLPFSSSGKAKGRRDARFISDRFVQIQRVLRLEREVSAQQAEEGHAFPLRVSATCSEMEKGTYRGSRYRRLSRERSAHSLPHTHRISETSHAAPHWRSVRTNSSFGRHERRTTRVLTHQVVPALVEEIRDTKVA
jgi:hypothetical protein